MTPEEYHDAVILEVVKILKKKKMKGGLTKDEEDFLFNIASTSDDPRDMGIYLRAIEEKNVKPLEKVETPTNDFIKYLEQKEDNKIKELENEEQILKEELKRIEVPPLDFEDARDKYEQAKHKRDEKREELRNVLFDLSAKDAHGNPKVKVPAERKKLETDAMYTRIQIEDLNLDLEDKKDDYKKFKERKEIEESKKARIYEVQSKKNKKKYEKELTERKANNLRKNRKEAVNNEKLKLVLSTLEKNANQKSKPRTKPKPKAKLVKKKVSK